MNMLSPKKTKFRKQLKVEFMEVQKVISLLIMEAMA
jgi:hypothetical protein